MIEELFKNQDTKYASFQSKLIPNIDKEKIVGVRVPVIRKIAKEYINTNEASDFLKMLPHNYIDEDMLHALLISQIKDYELCIEELERFLPYVNNWAVCDIMSPKTFKRNTDKLIEKIKEWINRKETYTCRFGIGMLMRYYLDEDFKKEYLEIPCKINSDEYYINMMIAWYYATALAKKWDYTISYLESKKLNKWIHNKTIQKACESYRITKEEKEYLKSLKM